MKLDRLLAILVILLRKERIPAKELAEKFGVSVRTILRDVEAINLAGIPVVTYQGMHGGIGIADGFRLDRSILTSDDMASIIASLKSMADTLPDQRHEILMEKFKHTLSGSQLQTLNTKINRLIIDRTPWGSYHLNKEKIALIRKAIEDSREIQFGYTDAKGSSSSRQTEPYSLVLKGQNWYLYAWCHLRQDFRVFKISRLKDLTVLELRFKPREILTDELKFDHIWYTSESIVEIELMFEPQMKSYAEEWFGEDIAELDDGRILAKAILPENNWLYGFILSFGTGVEVVNPPHIRTILAEIAVGIYKKYSD